MTPINIVWWSLGSEARGVHWDQTMIEDLLARRMWHPAGAYTFEHHQIMDLSWPLPAGDGAVFVVPARQNLDYVAELNGALASYRWCVVIGTGDEEGLCTPKLFLYTLVHAYPASIRFCNKPECMAVPGVHRHHPGRHSASESGGGRTPR